MKFSAILLAATVASSSAFAPSARNARCTTSLYETQRYIIEEGQPLCEINEDGSISPWVVIDQDGGVSPVYVAESDPSTRAKSHEEDLERTREFLMKMYAEDPEGFFDYCEPYTRGKRKSSQASTAAAPAEAKSSTGIELWSVDYDAAAMLAFKAAGSNGDFDAFKTQYLADTSAMVAEKNPYQNRQAPAAAAPAAAAPAETKSSTGIELWSVDYDAAAMLAFKAAGSNGDFDAFKTQYLADTSAMIAEKNPYKK